jgi:hypothetical protein
MKRILIIFAFFSACFTLYYSAKAQTGFKRNDTIIVNINSLKLSLPWSGGINFAQFSEIDLNKDGIKDLFAFDRSGNRIRTFINNGTAGVSDYVHAPQYIEKFPPLHDWVLLRDYNCDGKEDIFTYSNGGAAIYRNDSDASGLKFTLVTELLLTDYGLGQLYNLYISAVDFPAIVDVDGDGDLDILTFNIFGNFVEYHQNQSVELYGHCDSLKYVLVDACWGKFSEGNLGEINFNESCKGPVSNTEQNTLHAGSTLLAEDFTGNGLKDLLLGDVSFSNMNLLINQGSAASALMVSNQDDFPRGGVSVDIPYFPASFYLDVDNDGIKDLLASPNAANISENFRSVWFYKNLNRNDSALLSFQSDNFLQGEMIDVGEGAYPVLYDYDGDGDNDLFIGNYGYYTTGGNFSSQIALFKNTGNSLTPKFDLVTRDYANLSSLNLRNIYPTFGDIDGDGDADMIIGEQNGQLFFFENLAGAGNIPNFVLAQANYFSIDVGTSSTPQLFDVNNDGKLDLVIGERNGTLNYILNTGSVNSPQFLETNLIEIWGGVDVRLAGFTTGYSIPFIFRENGTTKLIVGSESRGLVYYTQIDNNLNGNFNYVTDYFEGINEGGRLSPFGRDINGDGHLDLFIGNYAGGLALFEGLGLVTIHNHINRLENFYFDIYPNPAQATLTIKANFDIPNEKYIIFNSLGSIVSEGALNSNIINIEELSQGMYFIRINNNCKRFIKN